MHDGSALEGVGLVVNGFMNILTNYNDDIVILLRTPCISSNGATNGLSLNFRISKSCGNAYLLLRSPTTKE